MSHIERVESIEVVLWHSGIHNSWWELSLNGRVIGGSVTMEPEEAENLGKWVANSLGADYRESTAEEIRERDMAERKRRFEEHTAGLGIVDPRDRLMEHLRRDHEANPDTDQ